MHLQRLKIREFRNLRDFEITFTSSANDADDAVREFKSHAVIGQNGSGKSNMIEAIVTIFRDLDLNQKTEFDYELDYWCRGHLIRVDSAAGKANVTDGNLRITLGVIPLEEDRDQDEGLSLGQGNDFKLSYLARHAKRYLPNHVFAYYSGRSERIEAIFQQHQQRFYKALLDGSDDLLRRLFYCRNVHSQFVLLAYLLKEDKECRSILKALGIEELESVLFVLKRPYWYKTDLAEEILKDGDNRFWYARGIVQTFLDQLWKESIAPIDHSESRLLDFRGRKETQDLLYLFVPDKDALGRVAENIGEPARFFKYLESTYISDLIDEVRINVKHRDIHGNLNFTQLSEGEQQLLTVLGLMRFTHEDESLFLLDEPDTHLNPIWKLRYFDEIDKVVKLQNGTVAGSSQLIITTHDPLMIGSLRKEQVRILRCEGGKTTVDTPDEHPQGMGVAGLLKSELFGLPSTLDSHTLKQLQRRNELLALKAKKQLTPKQEAELKKLRDQLDDLGFSREYRDPLYQQFIEQMYAVRRLPLDRILSPKQLKEQEALAKKVVTKIVRTEKTEELSALAQELKIAVTK
jgi:predicted ATPase